MKVIGKDLIITDPCYIAKDEDWGESFNWEDYCIEPFSEKTKRNILGSVE